MMNHAKGLFVGENMACMRGGRMLFQNLSFSLQEGEVLHVTGPNGAGKTSFLRIVSGALKLFSGSILWNGADFLQDGFETHAQKIGFLPPDDRSLKPLETVFENLLFWAAFWDVPQPRQAVDLVLKKMDVSALQETPVRYLSAGQKRRVSLARQFLRDVPLWILDEPLSGLDHEARGLFAAVVDQHTNQGGMVIVASHEPLSFAVEKISLLAIGGGA